MKSWNAPIRMRGCLVIIALAVGYYVVVWLPGLLNAVDRGKQKRTMDSMRRISDVLERYQRENGHYPPGGGLDRLFERGSPPLPRNDEWGRPFRYEPGEDGYLLASLGKDGEADFDRTATTLPIEQARFEADIVIRNGKFVQHPAAVVLP